jgi:hypothetical protein
MESSPDEEKDGADDGPSGEGLDFLATLSAPEAEPDRTRAI